MNDELENQQEIDFNGAAIINEKGEEVPITEEMVRRACEEIDPEIGSDSGDDLDG